MRFQDQKLQKLVNAAVAATLEIEAAEVDAANYADLENAQESAFATLVSYCIALLPQREAEAVRGNRIFRARVLDLYVYSQIPL